jgi:hypothetical protein
VEKLNPTQDEIQEKHRNNASGGDAAKLLELLKGVDVNELETALNAIKTAKKQALKADEGKYKNYLDKTPVYEDRDAYIYKRGDTKSGIWYFRIFDNKTNKPIFKSLKTTDKTTALATARVLYIEIKGKIERGEKLKTISAKELVEEWLKRLEKEITTIPHEGITPDTFKQKRFFMKNWMDYLESLNILKLPIDKIKPERTRDFAKWYRAKPKETALRTGARSVELINNNVNEVLRMYHKFAVRDKYISADRIPQLDRLKYQINDAFKRDIFTLEQYDRYITYLKRVYITKKHNPDLIKSKKGLDELEKRKIFAEFILCISNGGFRSKEQLGLKFKEIYSSPSFTEEERKENVVILIRKENSKTGRERRVVAPLKKRIDRIITAYKRLGITHEPDDFLFINAAYGRRTPLGRMIMYNRLKDTLIASGLQEELDKEGKSITPYSFRHFYAYLRLINKVPIHLLAKNMGTSIQKIESTYGHINTELHADTLTQGQGIIKRTETSLKTLPTLDE